MMRNRVYVFWMALLILVLITGCAPAAEPDIENEGEITEEAQPETEEPATNTPQPSNTPRPTETEKPTATRTPRPTNTPRPTATEEPTTQAAATQPSAAATTAPTQEATGEAAEVVPAGTTVWVLDTSPSETGSSAACPTPFYTDFYGLVRIETIDNGITWMRAQDGITYTLLRQSPNVYWGTGQSIYPGYTLTITAVFTSPTGMGATFVLIDQAIEGCNHYWKYGGTLR